MPKKPKLSHFTRMSIWAQKEKQAKKNKCCSNCAFYKRDYQCLKEPDAYIASTSEKTNCSDWMFAEIKPTYHRPL